MNVREIGCEGKRKIEIVYKDRMWLEEIDNV
jgi:hypothetical protein